MELNLSLAGGRLELTIFDDGCGFEAARVDPPDANYAIRNGSRDRASGNGLSNMRERVQSLDGAFVLESQPSKGTRITISVPLPPENE